ncbi:hypothetical protein [Arthrobacter rhombi]|uniref:hypothetical protein n=1 Tax=Arthrobacter rhombi TaxID=71253 RepID=UPI003FD2D1A5
MTTAIGRTGIISLDLPPEWLTGPERPEYELLAYLPSPKESFAPTIVVTANPFDGSIADFMRRVVDGVMEGTAAPQFIDIRGWTRAPGLAAGIELTPAEALAGRAVAYTQLSPSRGLSLLSTEFLFIEAGLAIQVTASTAVNHWQSAGPLLSEIVATVRLNRQPTENKATARPASLPPEAVDPVASAVFGHDVEKIAGLAGAQPFEFDGVWVHGRTIDTLTSLSDGLRLGALNKAEHSEQLDELEALELVNGTRLTDVGEMIGAHLTDPQSSYRITGFDTGGECWFQAWTYGPTALLLVEPGYHRNLGEEPVPRPSPEHFNLQLVPLTMLSTLMARWVGLQPAWNLQLEPAPLPVDDLARGWRGDRRPPEGSNEAMRSLWDEPWFSWTLTSAGADSEPEDIAYFNGGTVGHQRLFHQGDAAIFTPVPSTSVFLQIEDRIQATIFGHDPLML